MPFKKATKFESKLRMAICGPPGSGKTYSALKIASFLGEKIALIDTERGSASKYSGDFQFDVVELDIFSPENYILNIQDAEKIKYDVLIIDSLSHAWIGKGGILEFVENEKLKSKSGDAFTQGWRKATPKQNLLIDTILQAKLHIIVTMRTKMEYVIEKDEKTGRSGPRKIGLAPVQRDGLEYEFDIVGDMDNDNNYIISKSRSSAISGMVFPKPGEELAKLILNWLTGEAKPISPSTTDTEQLQRKQRGNKLITEKLAKMCGGDMEKMNITLSNMTPSKISITPTLDNLMEFSIPDLKTIFDKVEILFKEFEEEQKKG